MKCTSCLIDKPIDDFSEYTYSTKSGKKTSRRKKCKKCYTNMKIESNKKYKVRITEYARNYYYNKVANKYNKNYNKQIDNFPNEMMHIEIF